MAIMIASSVWPDWWEAGLRQAEGQASKHASDLCGDATKATQSKEVPNKRRTDSVSASGRGTVSECEHRVTCAGIGTHAHGPCESIRMFRKAEYLTDDN